MDKKFKFYTWTITSNILNCVLFAISFFIILYSLRYNCSGNLVEIAIFISYMMYFIGIILNAICIYKSNKYGKMSGGILGIIGNLGYILSVFIPFIVFPAFILLIISCIILSNVKSNN